MKRISPTAYARALLTVGRGKKDATLEEILKGFLAFVRRNNDWRKRDEIVRALETLLRREAQRHLLVIESARPLTTPQRAKLVANYPASHYDHEERIVSELAAGVRLTIDGEASLDGTLTRLLRRLF